MSKVSIVIPCFNGGAMVRDAVASALSQTHPDVEILVVDDESSDPITLRTLRDVEAAGQVKVVRQANQGLSGARNRGIDDATGAYILPLDHDDEIHPDYVAKAAAVLDARPDVGIVYSRVERFGASSGEWPLADFTLGRMLLGNLIHACAMFRREDWASVGGYSRELRKGHEDYDFWLQILGLGREVVRLDEVLFRYRDVEGSMAKEMSRQDRIDAFAHTLRSNTPLFLDNADAFAEALLGESEERWAVLAHYKRRYGRAEDFIARVGALRRRLRPRL